MADRNLRPALTQHLQQRLQAFKDGFRRNLAANCEPYRTARVLLNLAERD